MERFQNVLAWALSKFNHPQNNIYDASDKRSAHEASHFCCF